MSSPVPDPAATHPLFGDEAELNTILDVMYAQIHRTLKRRNPGLRREGATYGTASKRETAIQGTGASADDILAEALAALLEKTPEDVRHSWRSLAVGIARNKAVQALRDADKGLRGTDQRAQLRLISGDETVPSDEDDRTVLELTSDPTKWESTEAEYEALADVLKVRDLARLHLSDRDQIVFFRIHFEGYKRGEVADEVGLTRQRVGQIYDASVGKLEALQDYPFSPLTATDQGGSE